MRTFRHIGGLAILIALIGAVGCTPTPDTSIASNTGTTKAAVSPVPAPESDLPRDGSADRPLRYLMMPVEGGAADKAVQGIQPILTVVEKETGYKIEPLVSNSYADVLAGMTTRKGDFAQMAPYIYLMARKTGVAELLAVAKQPGADGSYRGGIFCRTDSGIKTLADLKGKSVAFADLNSSSGFNYPCAMMLRAGIDPAKDLGKIFLAGSHVNAISALAAGKVDVCCCTTGTFEKAVEAKRIDPKQFKLLARSEPIPGSPLAMSTKLPDEMKAKLRKAYAGLATNPLLGEKGLRSADGKKLEKFDTTVTDAEYDKFAKFIAPVTESLKAEMIEKAGRG